MVVLGTPPDRLRWSTPVAPTLRRRASTAGRGSRGRAHDRGGRDRPVPPRPRRRPARPPRRRPGRDAGVRSSRRRERRAMRARLPPAPTSRTPGSPAHRPPDRGRAPGRPVAARGRRRRPAPVRPRSRRRRSSRRLPPAPDLSPRRHSGRGRSGDPRRSSRRRYHRQSHAVRAGDVHRRRSGDAPAVLHEPRRAGLRAHQPARGREGRAVRALLALRQEPAPPVPRRVRRRPRPHRRPHRRRDRRPASAPRSSTSACSSSTATTPSRSSAACTSRASRRRTCSRRSSSGAG